MTDDERRRALDSLVQVGGRMRYLATRVLQDKPDLPKLAGELEGMAAWVVAFARVALGQPCSVLEGEPIPLELVGLRSAGDADGSWRAYATLDTLVTETRALPSERTAAATALATLALQLVRGVELDGARTPSTEGLLAQRLSQALCMFHEVDLVPELNAHGMPEDG